MFTTPNWQGITPEVASMFMSYFSDTANPDNRRVLSRLLKVCHSWSRIAEAVLWNTIELTTTCSERASQTDSLMVRWATRKTKNIRPKILVLDLQYESNKDILFNRSFILGELVRKVAHNVRTLELLVPLHGVPPFIVVGLKKGLDFDLLTTLELDYAVDSLPDRVDLEVDIHMSSVLRKMTCLQNLKVTNANWILPDDLTRLTSLRVLNINQLSQATPLSEDFYEAVGRLTQLQSLTIVNDNTLEDTNCLMYLSPLVNLQELSFESGVHAEDIDTEALLRLLACVGQNLVKFSVVPDFVLFERKEVSRPKITPKFLGQHCPHLVTLVMRDLRKDWTVRDIVEFYKCLPELDYLCIGEYVNDVGTEMDVEFEKDLEYRETLISFEWFDESQKPLLHNNPGVYFDWDTRWNSLDLAPVDKSRLRRTSVV